MLDQQTQATLDWLRGRALHWKLEGYFEIEADFQRAAAALESRALEIDRLQSERDTILADMQARLAALQARAALLQSELRPGGRSHLRKHRPGLLRRILYRLIA